MSKPKCVKPCPGCPWLVSNHGRENPPGVEELRAKGDTEIMDWYSTKNLKRLWNGIRKGEMMSCHNTEPEAHTFGGKAHPGATPQVCAGALALVVKHVNSIERFPSIAAYTKAGPMQLTKQGARDWVERAIFGRLPTVEIPQAVGLPWDDPIANAPHPNASPATTVAT